MVESRAFFNNQPRNMIPPSIHIEAQAGLTAKTFQNYEDDGEDDYKADENQDKNEDEHEWQKPYQLLSVGQLAISPQKRRSHLKKLPYIDKASA